MNVAKQREFTGWHMLAILVGFFGVVIGVNVWLAVASSRTWTGLVVENSYVASQEFNGKLAVARERSAKGWTGGLDYAAGNLVFSLVDKAGDPIALEGVSVEVSRPVGIHGDRTLDLARATDGTYTAPIALDAGVWNAAIVAKIANQADYEHRARLIVK